VREREREGLKKREKRKNQERERARKLDDDDEGFNPFVVGRPLFFSRSWFFSPFSSSSLFLYFLSSFPSFTLSLSLRH